jgi:MFS family permease
MAVQGNVRVASASRRSFGDALRIAYRAGTITGMLTDGLGLLGGTLIFIFLGMGIVSPILAIYAETFNVTYALVSFAISMYAIGRLFADIPVGVLADRYGRKPMMIGGTYYLLAGDLPLWVVIASLPYALGVTTVLFGKHIDKML